MSEPIIPIDVFTDLVAIVAGVLFTLVGVIYNKIRKRLDDIEENVGELESEVIKLKRDIDTAQMWLFGDDETKTDGFVKDIKELNEKLGKLIDALHDEQSLDFDRDDIED